MKNVSNLIGVALLASLSGCTTDLTIDYLVRGQKIQADVDTSFVESYAVGDFTVNGDAERGKELAGHVRSFAAARSIVTLIDSTEEADGVLKGQLDLPEVDETRERIQNTDKDGRVYYTYNIIKQCAAIGSYELVISGQVAGGHNAPVDWSKTVSSSKGFVDALKSLPHNNEIHSDLIEEFAQKVVGGTLPHSEQKTVKLIKANKPEALKQAIDFLESRDIERAKAELDRLLAGADLVTPRQQAIAHYSRAIIHELEGWMPGEPYGNQEKYQEAVEGYNRAIDLDPKEKIFQEARRRASWAEKNTI